MNLYQAIKHIKDTAGKSVFVQSVKEGDVYENLNSTQQKYPVINVTVDNIGAGSADNSAIALNIFYIDRLEDANENKAEVQSMAVTVLSQILTELEDTFDVTPKTFYPFTEKFADLCAGCYCTCTLETQLDPICDDSVFVPRELSIKENGTYDVKDYDVADVDVSSEQILIEYFNNGGNLAYYDGDKIPKFDWTKLNKNYYKGFLSYSKCTWEDIQNFINTYSDENRYYECLRSIILKENKADVFITIPKGFKNTKKNNCILETIEHHPGLKKITIDCNDLENTGTLLGWTSGNFTLKLLNTQHLKEFYNPTSGIRLEAFDCSALQKTPYNGVYNSTDYIGGFIDLGKGFLQNGKAADHLMYFGSYMQNLTKESLLNIFNGLYDLNLLGFEFVNQPTFKMGAKNFAKVTDEEIKIATDKGWIVTQ